jgi:hypothetical protein
VSARLQTVAQLALRRAIKSVRDNSVTVLTEDEALAIMGVSRLPIGASPIGGKSHRLDELESRLTTSEARCAELVEALEAVDSEVLLTGNLKDIVDAALARSLLLEEYQ